MSLFPGKLAGAVYRPLLSSQIVQFMALFLLQDPKLQMGAQQSSEFKDALDGAEVEGTAGQVQEIS